MSFKNGSGRECASVLVLVYCIVDACMVGSREVGRFLQAASKREEYVTVGEGDQRPGSGADYIAAANHQRAARHRGRHVELFLPFVFLLVCSK